MKPQALALSLTRCCLFLGTVVGLVPSAQSQPPTFTCVLTGDYPTTYVRTRRGQTVQLILWKSQHFAPAWPPQKRCQNVSSRFEQLYQNGQLKYLTTGLRAGQNVICTATHPDSGCKDVVFTLTPGTNPRLALERIRFRGTAARGGPLSETGDRPYVDLDADILDVDGAEMSQERQPAED